MNILIRCDSSNIIGTGHVMRCLNLASYYPQYKFTFVCRNFNMNISEKIKENKHMLVLLDYNIEPQINNYVSWLGKDYNEEKSEILDIIKKIQYDIIIIDHYGVDCKLERELTNFCDKVVVISDIFDFKHYCHLFINYNCDDLQKVKMVNLNEETTYKIGAKNIIINKKFIESKKKQHFNKSIQIITINMGGSDPQNFILKTLQIINDFVIKNSIIVNVVIGKSNSNTCSIKDFVGNNQNYNLLYDLNYDDLIDLYIKSDLSIGSLSITAYERLHLNIPQICLKIIDNQLIQELDEFHITKLDGLMKKILEYNNFIKHHSIKSNETGVPNVTSLLTFLPNISQ